MDRWKRIRKKKKNEGKKKKTKAVLRRKKRTVKGTQISESMYSHSNSQFLYVRVPVSSSLSVTASSSSSWFQRNMPLLCSLMQTFSDAYTLWYAFFFYILLPSLLVLPLSLLLSFFPVLLSGMHFLSLCFFKNLFLLFDSCKYDFLWCSILHALWFRVYSFVELNFWLFFMFWLSRAC